MKNKNKHPKPIKKVSIESKEHQSLGTIIGNRCKICRKQKNIRYHEIHGKKHEHSNAYILNHASDFVPLCQRCHSMLHSAKRVEKLPEIYRKQLVRLLSKIK